MSWLSTGDIQHLREVAAEPDLTQTKYALVRTLGRGGMATVYLAQDQELDREVALKVLDLPDTSGDLAKRMLREAKIVARLEHPGIVPIHDVGILPDKRVFYTMKHVKGDRLDQFAPTNLPERLRVFQQICQAVGFAHARGVIHRDLKPQNVMVGGFGEVLVMDWGLAKVLNQTEEFPSDKASAVHQKADVPLTEHGSILGTPAYMAPEQASGENTKLNERTDVFALGAILYFLLTGFAPFPDSSNASIDRNRLIPPRKRDRKIARSIEGVCLKAMAYRQEDRYANALELANDVVRYLDGFSVTAYRENPLEMVQRWVKRNYFVVLLVLSYLLMRILILLLTGR